MMKCAQRLALAGAISVVASFGQSADTRILGSIVEQSGSIGVGSVATISSRATGFSKSRRSGADGQCEPLYLLPATCVVEVQINGFRTRRSDGITVRIGLLPRFDFKTSPYVSLLPVSKPTFTEAMCTEGPSQPYRLHSLQHHHSAWVVPAALKHSF